MPGQKTGMAPGSTAPTGAGATALSQLLGPAGSMAGGGNTGAGATALSQLMGPGGTAATQAPAGFGGGGGGNFGGGGNMFGGPMGPYIPPPGGGGGGGPASGPSSGGAGSKPGGATGSVVPGGFQNWLNTQFGTGNPFGAPVGGGPGGQMASGAGGSLGNLGAFSTGNQWYGGSPIATAQAAANQNLGVDLAGIRSRFGQQGLGTSSREALAEGTAAAQTNTQLGAQLAQLGVGARQGDIANAISAYGQQGNLGLGLGNLQNQQANTALNAVLGGGALNQQAAQNLAQAGGAITGIGQGEQNIPNLGPLGSLLSAFQTVTGTGTQGQKGSQGWWTK